jgi:hypothetical protein
MNHGLRKPAAPRVLERAAAAAIDAEVRRRWQGQEQDQEPLTLTGARPTHR